MAPAPRRKQPQRKPTDKQDALPEPDAPAVLKAKLAKEIEVAKENCLRALEALLVNSHLAPGVVERIFSGKRETFEDLHLGEYGIRSVSRNEAPTAISLGEFASRSYSSPSASPASSCDSFSPPARTPGRLDLSTTKVPMAADHAAAAAAGVDVRPSAACWSTPLPPSPRDDD